jgi:hypothetical protein
MHGPYNKICNLVLKQVDMFFLIVQEREDDLTISKHVAQLYIQTQLSNKDCCVEVDSDLFIHINGKSLKFPNSAWR